MYKVDGLGPIFLYVCTLRTVLYVCTERTSTVVEEGLRLIGVRMNNF